MRARILRLAEHLKASYWFLPALMAFAAIVLAIVMLGVDARFGDDWMAHAAWLHRARADGARQVLSSIAGSMITVAGTVFSVTIAAVVYASGQYGPRLLSNFMSDRGNQVTLGTFIATFVYCLLVLRTIQAPEEGGGAGFVPNDALLVGVALTLCSIAVLIFFIHHVPSRIHINAVIEGIGSRLVHEIDERFPGFIGGDPDDSGDGDDPDVPRTFRRDAAEEAGDARRLISSTKTGYIQVLDEATLIAVAREHDLVLRLQYQPGDFAHVGRTLVEAWPPEACDDEAVSAIREAFGIGASRSAMHDLRFLIDELVEIAARALSPAVNDPFTAITCLDWLAAALSDLAGRKLPRHLRMDEDGRLRVIAHPQTFALFVDRAFGAVAQYCATDMNAGLRYIRALGEVALDCDDDDRLACLRERADGFEKLYDQALTGFNLARLQERTAELRAALARPDYKRRLRDSTAWLGGTA
jgi:uncharacterized membrane protein